MCLAISGGLAVSASASGLVPTHGLTANLPDPNDPSITKRFANTERWVSILNSSQRETGFCLSPDGRRAYFASDASVPGWPRIVTAEQNGGVWSATAEVAEVATLDPETFRFAPSISVDGQYLHLVQGRVADSSLGTQGGQDHLLRSARILVSRYDPNGWTEPVDPGNLINSSDPNVTTTDPVLSPDGKVLIFASDRAGGLGGLDLWRAERDGTSWQTPINLSALNSPADDTGPSIGPDGKSLYFASNRTGGYGLSDIWVTDFDGATWSTPRNLGPQINSAGEEFDPHLGPNGTWLTFSGIRAENQGVVDLYRARRIDPDGHVSLGGEWLAYPDPDPNTIYPVQVPFSNAPEDRMVAYAKVFSLPEGMCDDRCILHFDGITGHGEIYLNGTYLGEQESFVPFWYDVSDLVYRDGENLLAIAIDDTLGSYSIPNDDIPWVHYCGISRDVHITCATGVELLRSEPQYTFGPDYSTVSGTITAKAIGAPGTEVSFTGEWLAPASLGGGLAAALQTDVAIVDPNGYAVAVLDFDLNTPALWSSDSPTLYTLTVNASVDGQIVSKRTVKTGFREISITDETVHLNGQPILLKGVSRHDIYPDTGYVGTRAQMLSDMTRLKESGANYIRLVHYPHPEFVLDLADELGLMVSEELPAWANFWDADVKAKVFEIARKTVSRDMHHPSVFLWISGTARAHPTEYCTEAQALFKSLDPSRLASYVIDNDEYHPEAIAEDVALVQDANLDLLMKITWWFYYLEYLQDAWTNFPDNIPIVIAELGREGNSRQPIVVDGDDEYWWREDQQADEIAEMLEAWRPRTWMYSSDKHIAGLCIFNWQDIPWPGVDLYLPNHVPWLHWGMVYDDRQGKRVLQAVTDFYQSLPNEFVGLPQSEDQAVAELFIDPQNMGPDVNGDFRESGPSLSADGQRMYFASDGADFVSLPRIFFIDRDGAGWTEPLEVPLPPEPEFFAFRRGPCISPDGLTLYFTRALVSGIYIAQTRIWKSEFVGGFWSDPVDLGDGVNDPDAGRTTSDPTLTGDGLTMYLSSDRDGGQGRSDLWMTQQVGGQWTAPVNLGPTINSEHGESEPSVTPDGQTLFFSSDRPGGQGSSDIWVSHLIDDTWTEPKNLGPAFNSIGSEREPEIAPNGAMLYFTGSRAGGLGLSDLWQATSLCALSDCDQDGQVTFADAEMLWIGMAGPQQIAPPACDIDLDHDADISDYMRQQRCPH
jgi:Tol biopolymer transport system component